MKCLVESGLNGSALAEADEQVAGPIMRGIGTDRSTLDEADKTFEHATAAEGPAARSLIARLRSTEDATNEVSQPRVRCNTQRGDRGGHSVYC